MGSVADNVPVSSLVFPWNIFNLNSSDVDYGATTLHLECSRTRNCCCFAGMAVSDSPYVPTARGRTLALVLQLLNAMPWVWVSADPWGTGMLPLGY
jgi:hypothetical protein